MELSRVLNFLASKRGAITSNNSELNEYLKRVDASVAATEQRLKASQEFHASHVHLREALQTHRDGLIAGAYRAV